MTETADEIAWRVHREKIERHEEGECLFYPCEDQYTADGQYCTYHREALRTGNWTRGEMGCHDNAQARGQGGHLLRGIAASVPAERLSTADAHSGNAPYQWGVCRGHRVPLLPPAARPADVVAAVARSSLYWAQHGIVGKFQIQDMGGCQGMNCDKCGGEPEHFYRLQEPQYWGDVLRFCSLTCLIEWAAEPGRETPFAVIERPEKK